HLSHWNTLIPGPGSGTDQAGTSHTVKAQLTSAAPNVPVRFTVTGTNATSGTAYTDGTGAAYFTYPDFGGNGTDTISAYVDFNDDHTLNGSGSQADFSADNTLTKYWITASATPLAAQNPVGTTHTVNLQLSGPSAAISGVRVFLCHSVGGPFPVCNAYKTTNALGQASDSYSYGPPPSSPPARNDS